MRSRSRLDTHHKMESPAQWVYIGRIVRRSKDKSATYFFKPSRYILLYLFKGHVGSQWLAATHAVTVKETTGGVTSSSKRPLGIRSQSAHIERGNTIKPKRITNETTWARIYEVLKPSPPYCFFRKKKPHHAGWRNEKQQGALEGERYRKMEREGWPARRQKNILLQSCLRREKKRREEWVRGNHFPSNSRAPFPAHRYPAITNVKVLSWVIMSQTCCQCLRVFCYTSSSNLPRNLLLRKRTNIYLIQIGMYPCIQQTSQT